MLVLYSMVAHTDLLRAVLYEKEDNFVALCNPEKQEDEETEPEKPDFTFRDEFGELRFDSKVITLSLYVYTMFQSSVLINN